jgi:hypothetical protein
MYNHQRVVRILLIVLIVCFPALLRSEPAGKKDEDLSKKRADDLQAHLDAKKIKNNQDLLTHSIPAFIDDFSFIIASKSSQKGDRAVLFNRDGSIFIGIGAHHTRGETVLSDLKTGGRSFHEINNVTEKGLRVGEANPQKCEECHSKKLLFIWPSYGDSASNVTGGGADNVRDGQHLSKKEGEDRWKALFAAKKKCAEMHVSSPGKLIARLTARRLVHDVRTTYPERYAKFRYAFLRRLLDCPSNEEEANLVLQSYSKLVKSEDQVWPNWLKHSEQEVRLLQLLGTNPDEIILKKRVYEPTGPSDTEGRFKDFVKEWKNHLPYRQYSDGSGDFEAMKNYMLVLLQPEFGVGTKKYTDEEFHTEYVIEKPSFNRTDCTVLEKKSLDVLRDSPLPSGAQFPSPENSVHK